MGRKVGEHSDAYLTTDVDGSKTVVYVQCAVCGLKLEMTGLTKNWDQLQDSQALNNFARMGCPPRDEDWDDMDPPFDDAM